MEHAGAGGFDDLVSGIGERLNRCSTELTECFGKGIPDTSWRDSICCVA